MCRQVVDLRRRRALARDELSAIELKREFGEGEERKIFKK
jgi:hypothetical protein